MDLFLLVILHPYIAPDTQMCFQLPFIIAVILITVRKGLLLLLTVLELSLVSTPEPDYLLVITIVPGGSFVLVINVPWGSPVVITVSDGSIIPITGPDGSVVLITVPDAAPPLITHFAPACRPIRAPSCNMPSRFINCRVKVIATTRHSERVTAWSGHTKHTILASICVGASRAAAPCH